MTWPLKFIDSPAKGGPRIFEIGDCWFVTPDSVGHYYLKELSQNYRSQNEASRPPVCVWLPNHTIFCLDQCPLVNGEWVRGGGWGVTGVMPNFTVTLSINCAHSYHGFITNGIISDDCDGRIYDAQGYIANAPT